MMIPSFSPLFQPPGNDNVTPHASLLMVERGPLSLPQPAMPRQSRMRRTWPRPCGARSPIRPRQCGCLRAPMRSNWQGVSGRSGSAASVPPFARAPGRWATRHQTAGAGRPSRPSLARCIQNGRDGLARETRRQRGEWRDTGLARAATRRGRKHGASRARFERAFSVHGCLALEDRPEIIA